MVRDDPPKLPVQDQSEHQTCWRIRCVWLSKPWMHDNELDETWSAFEVTGHIHVTKEAGINPAFFITGIDIL